MRAQRYVFRRVTAALHRPLKSLNQASTPCGDGSRSLQFCCESGVALGIGRKRRADSRIGLRRRVLARAVCSRAGGHRSVAQFGVGEVKARHVRESKSRVGAASIQFQGARFPV